MFLKNLYVWFSFIAVYQRFFHKNSGNKVFILTVSPRFKGFKIITINDIVGSKDY